MKTIILISLVAISATAKENHGCRVTFENRWEKIYECEQSSEGPEHDKKSNHEEIEEPSIKRPKGKGAL